MAAIHPADDLSGLAARPKVLAELWTCLRAADKISNLDNMWEVVQLFVYPQTALQSFHDGWTTHLLEHKIK